MAVSTYIETVQNGRTIQHLEVLSCGAGRQSSALVLMACHGEIAKPDFVIMADTGDELSKTIDYWETVLVPAMDKAGIHHVVAQVERVGRLVAQIRKREAGRHEDDGGRGRELGQEVSRAPAAEYGVAAAAAEGGAIAPPLDVDHPGAVASREDNR